MCEHCGCKNSNVEACVDKELKSVKSALIPTLKSVRPDNLNVLSSLALALALKSEKVETHLKVKDEKDEIKKVHVFQADGALPAQSYKEEVESEKQFHRIWKMKTEVTTWGDLAKDQTVLRLFPENVIKRFKRLDKIKIKKTNPGDMEKVYRAQMIAYNSNKLKKSPSNASDEKENALTFR